MVNSVSMVQSIICRFDWTFRRHIFIW